MCVTTLAQSTSMGLDGRPSIATLPPWVRFSIISGSAVAWPLISSPTSKPSRMPRRSLRVGDAFARDVNGEVGAHAAGELQARLGDVRDDDEAGAHVTHHGRRHEADGPAPGDEHVLADERKLQRGVHRVAERVEDRGEVEVDALGREPRHSTRGEPRTRRRRRRGSRRGPKCGCTCGGGPRGSCGTCRTRCGPRRRRSPRRERRERRCRRRRPRR